MLFAEIIPSKSFCTNRFFGSTLIFFCGVPITFLIWSPSLPWSHNFGGKNWFKIDDRSKLRKRSWLTCFVELFLWNWIYFRFNEILHSHRIFYSTYSAYQASLVSQGKLTKLWPYWNTWKTIFLGNGYY